MYSNCVLENNTGTDMVQKDIVIPAHSIYVGVDCIETDDLLADIAGEISRAKPIGIGMVHDGVKDATLISRNVAYGYDNGYSQPIYFYKAKKTAILVDVTYSYGKYTGADINKDIADVVAEYIDTVGVGGIVYGTMIANELINKLNIGIGTVWLQKEGSNKPADNSVEMMGYETPYAVSDNISITEIT